MPLPGELTISVKELLATVSQPGVAKLVSTLEKSGQGLFSRNELVSIVDLPEHRMAVGDLFDCWQRSCPDVSAKTLSYIIVSAERSLIAVNHERSQSLVWTGPDVKGPTMRRTDQALLELIEGAKHDLLIVTFAAYKVPVIVHALLAATESGVRIRFVAETVDDSAKVSFDAAGALGARLGMRCEIYVWPNDQRAKVHAGKYGSLHAKVAVADSNVMLISSANLTDYAMMLNMEMGVLLRGGELPKRAAAAFDELIRDGVLVRK